MAKTSYTTGKSRTNPTKTRVLISVSVHGSTGPLRMVVNDTDTVSRVIQNTFKLYAREGRLPVLESDHDQYFLYCRDHFGCHTILDSSEAVGLTGIRSFQLVPKKPKPLRNANNLTEKSRPATGTSLRSWINKSGVKIAHFVKQ